MSFKISTLKKPIPTESYSLVMLCLLNTKYLSCTTPVLAKQLVHTYLRASAFSTLMQYMSASHGYSTMGGIEYDDGGCVEKTKKEKIVSHHLGVSTGYGDVH